MIEDTKIEWCDSTVNPVMGCDGCELWEPVKGIFRCYAGVLHDGADGKKKGSKPGHAPRFSVVTPFPGRMLKAASASDLHGTNRDHKPWLNRASRSIFVSDMGDALSSSVPFAYLEREILPAVASEAGRRHRWLWLTKRPERMAEFHDWVRSIGWTWPVNLWVGTSVTTKKSLPRARHLVGIGDGSTVMKFLSVEPQSEDVDLSQYVGDVQWVIQGGESGDAPLPFDVAWARRLREACAKAGTPYFLKQLGRRVIENGAAVDLGDKKGGSWLRWPRDVAIREVPGVARKWSRPTG